MSSGDLIELDVGTGILAFDGRVLEAFGFGDSDCRRVHAAAIKAMKLEDGRVLGAFLYVDGLPLELAYVEVVPV